MGLTSNIVLEDESFGRAENFMPIHINRIGKAGEIVKVKIHNIEETKLYGEVII